MHVSQTRVEAEEFELSGERGTTGWTKAGRWWTPDTE